MFLGGFAVLNSDVEKFVCHVNEFCSNVPYRRRACTLRHAPPSASWLACSWLDWLDGTAATRKPRLLSRPRGPPAKRSAARQPPAELRQPPPRITRSEASSATDGVRS